MFPLFVEFWLEFSLKVKGVEKNANQPHDLQKCEDYASWNDDLSKRIKFCHIFIEYKTIHLVFWFVHILWYTIWQIFQCFIRSFSFHEV